LQGSARFRNRCDQSGGDRPCTCPGYAPEAIASFGKHQDGANQPNPFDAATLQREIGYKGPLTVRTQPTVNVS
jgi:hypothetical protein